MRILVAILVVILPACTTTSPRKLARDALEFRHSQTLAPAMAYAVASSQGLIDASAIGMVSRNSTERVAIHDAFHLGSVVKPITATVAATRVSRGEIDWNTRIIDVFPEHGDSPYSHVSLEELLSHRSGLPALDDDPGFAAVPEFNGTSCEQRRQFTRWVLTQPREAPMGTMHYSNAGYAVAAAMLEARSGSCWEDLVREDIINTVVMPTSGFQAPPQVRGHVVVRNELRVAGPDEWTMPLALAPAGDLHASVVDVARFAMQYLRAMKDENSLLPSRQIGYMQQRDMAWGRQVYRNKTLLFHVGSAGSFVMIMAVLPDADRAFVVSANAGTRGAEAALVGLLDKLLAAYAP